MFPAARLGALNRVQADQVVKWVFFHERLCLVVVISAHGGPPPFLQAEFWLQDKREPLDSEEV